MASSAILSAALSFQARSDLAALVGLALDLTSLTAFLVLAGVLTGWPWLRPFRSVFGALSAALFFLLMPSLLAGAMHPKLARSAQPWSATSPRGADWLPLSALIAWVVLFYLAAVVTKPKVVPRWLLYAAIIVLPVLAIASLLLLAFAIGVDLSGLK